MIFTIPASLGEPEPLLEFNSCHEPAGSPRGGQFCVTRVGATSARPKDDPGFRSNRTVYRDMAVVWAQLKAIPGVRHVSVKPGLGAWKTGHEPSWIIAYQGNGQARRLLARVERQFNQDAILLMHPCKGAQCDPPVEFHFQKPVGLPLMEDIDRLLGAEGLGGWTWGKRQAKTVLRMVSVPEWGGNRTLHLDYTARISRILSSCGVDHRVKFVRTEVLDRDRGDYERTQAALGAAP